MAINIPGAAASVGEFATKSIQKAAGSVFDLLDPSNARRSISGLFAGGASSDANTAQSPNIEFKGESNSAIEPENDWRVRVSLAAEGAKIFYKDEKNTLMTPLVETNGVIFPYTPQITVQHQAIYNSVPLTHSNYSSQFYQGSDVNEITITGDFTVQSVSEGRYLLASIYFFRAATKMFFGQGELAGNPPPMVFLDGYGAHYFPHVPCVLTSFSHVLSNDVDYIEIPITKTSLEEVAGSPITPGVDNSGMVIPPILQSKPTKNTSSMAFKSSTATTRVPTASSVTITLKPVYSRKNIHQNFDLAKFANGDLLNDKNKGTGGFI